MDTLKTLGFAGIAIASVWYFARRAGRPLPPGPKPDPFIGNLRHIPTGASWLTYTDWKKIYGDIIHLSVLGTNLVILGSYEAAKTVMELRGNADRPTLPMTDDLMGWSKSIPSSKVNDRWRKSRKYFHRLLSKTATQQFYPVLEDAAGSYLRQLLAEPTASRELTHLMVVKMVAMMTYGYDVKSSKDNYIETAEQAMSYLGRSAQPGAFMVNVIPALKSIPPWFPGAGFHAIAKEWGSYLTAMVDIPFEYVTNAMATGSYIPSFVSTLMETDSGEADIIKWTAGSMFVGGTHTNLGTISFFFLAMLHYPEIQKKAQAEIDKVVGTERLPKFSDYGKLPYIDAVIKETMRWKPVGPFGLPHEAGEDCIYNGYRIPRGSVLFANVWAISQDEKRYPSPEIFRPERFIENPNLLDPREFAFGFGRRVCPGREFAEAVIFMCIVSVLSVFDIVKARDKDGKEIEAKIEISPEFVTYPLPFECVVKPRSPIAEGLIKQGLNE